MLGNLTQIYDWGYPTENIKTYWWGKIKYHEYLERQKRRLDKIGDRDIEWRERMKNGERQIALFGRPLCLETGCRETATHNFYCGPHNRESFNRKYARL